MRLLGGALDALDGLVDAVLDLLALAVGLDAHRGRAGVVVDRVEVDLPGVVNGTRAPHVRVVSGREGRIGLLDLDPGLALDLTGPPSCSILAVTSTLSPSVFVAEVMRGK